MIIIIICIGVRLSLLILRWQYYRISTNKNKGASWIVGGSISVVNKGSVGNDCVLINIVVGFVDSIFIVYCEAE